MVGRSLNTLIGYALRRSSACGVQQHIEALSIQVFSSLLALYDSIQPFSDKRPVVLIARVKAREVPDSHTTGG